MRHSRLLSLGTVLSLGFISFAHAQFPDALDPLPEPAPDLTLNLLQNTAPENISGFQDEGRIEVSFSGPRGTVSLPTLDDYYLDITWSGKGGERAQYENAVSLLKSRLTFSRTNATIRGVSVRSALQQLKGRISDTGFIKFSIWQKGLIFDTLCSIATATPNYKDGKTKEYFLWNPRNENATIQIPKPGELTTDADLEITVIDKYTCDVDGTVHLKINADAP